MEGLLEQIETITEENPIVVMRKEDITAICQEAAQIGAKAAMEKLNQEKKRISHELVDKRLHNVKLLLKNYHMLKENADNSIFGRIQMEESAADILCSMMNLYSDEVIVDSIKRSATRTAIIVSHIEIMISLYDAYCEKSSNELDRRRYEVMFDMYIAENTLNAKQIAKKQNMSKENVYADMKIAFERMSALLFGVDGLRIS